MKKLVYKAAFVVMALAVLSSCKKEDDNGGSGGNNNPNPAPMPSTIVGEWEIQGANLPTQNYRDKYSKWTFTVNADNTYSMKYYDKQNAITDFKGTVVVSKSTVKHTSGSDIFSIQIIVQTINGQSAPGGWKGIYAFETGGIMKLNIEPNVNGVTAPTPTGGFGSGSSGNNAVFNFVKK